MSEITTVTFTRTSSQTGTLSWTSTDATEYYVYECGELLRRVRGVSIEVAIPFGTSPVWQVFDSSTDVPDYAISGHSFLTWYSVTNAVQYRIEEYVTDAWVLRQTIIADGKQYYEHKTRWLPNGETILYQVVPVAEGGVTGEAREYTLKTARHPDVPLVELESTAGIVPEDPEEPTPPTTWQIVAAT